MATKMCVAAANHIIRLTNEYNSQRPHAEQISMTCKRLQKILYFSDIAYMKSHNGDSMFTDQFYAWPSGPVIPSVYYRFMQYQNGEMLPASWQGSDLEQDQIATIEEVFKQTASMDTLDLVDFSHIPGGPWCHAFNPDDPEHMQIVPKERMYAFYRNRPIFTNELSSN